MAWIPEHSGNETVDTWAAHTGSQVHAESPMISVRPINHGCSSPGLDSGSCRELSIHPEIHIKPWFAKFKKMNKDITAIICRLRLNHSCTPVLG